MSRSSPVKPLMGRFLLTQKDWATVFDPDGTPRENRTRSTAHPDPTLSTALRLIAAERRMKAARAPRHGGRGLAIVTPAVTCMQLHQGVVGDSLSEKRPDCGQPNSGKAVQDDPSAQ